MAKKSLTQSQFIDAVRNILLKEYEYEEDDFTKADVKACLEAAAELSIERAPDKNGSIVYGIGKLRIHKRPAGKARMGRNPATGEEIKIKARPASYVPKFRMSKACKDGCAELVVDKNKKLAKAFRAKKRK